MTQKFISFSLISIGTLLILTLFAQQADQLGILQKLNQQTPDGSTMIFSILMTIPAAIILFWPVVVRREILLPPVRVGGCNWRIVVTRWRVAFIAALICIGFLGVLA